MYIRARLRSGNASSLRINRYERNASENARNGSFKKNLTTENGQLELEVPRDRKGSFEPVIVKKKQTRIEGLDDKIISLYAKGMSVSDIKIQMQELYGAVCLNMKVSGLL